MYYVGIKGAWVPGKSAIWWNRSWQKRQRRYLNRNRNIMKTVRRKMFKFG